MLQLSETLEGVLRDRLVAPLYQPIVDLDREVVVGYEALARGPQGPLSGPAALFGAARREGRLVELDWLCREQAVAGARAAGLRHPLSLFVNAEPETLLASVGDAARWRDFADIRCYAELTERALVAEPAALLRAVDQVREQDWGIALDDVGVHPASVALLPLLQPDVIKLDMRLLHHAPTAPGDVEVARVLHAAMRQASATGAVVVAEGIETEEQLDLARAHGAHYGQGFLLGRPGPLPDVLVTPRVAVPLVRRLLDRTVPPSPFAVVASTAPTRRLGRASVREVARQLLAQATLLGEDTVVLVCVSAPDLLPGGAEELLDDLAGSPLSALLGRPVAAPATVRLRRQELSAGDPAGEDFDVVVMSPHFAAAVVSRPALPGGPDGALDAVLTFDRDLVAVAAHALVQRL